MRHLKLVPTAFSSFPEVLLEMGAVVVVVVGELEAVVEVEELGVGVEEVVVAILEATIPVVATMIRTRAHGPHLVLDGTAIPRATGVVLAAAGALEDGLAETARSLSSSS
jgi:hypothetical protein